MHVDNADSASYTYTPLNNATLTVVATFMGNDKYNSNASKEKQFIVNRTPTSIQVTFNTPIISSGDDAYVIITMDPSINANVILHHGDKDYDVAVVSRVKNRKQKMSHRMAFKISQVFGIDLNEIMLVENVE